MFLQIKTQIDKITSKFTKGGYGHSVIVLTIGTAIAQIIMIVTTPILSRLYDPEDFGLLATFSAVSGITATIVTLRYETAILIPKKEKEAAVLVLLSLLLAVVFSLFFTLVSILIPVSIYELVGINGKNIFYTLALLLGGMFSVITINQNWLNRNKLYSYMALVRSAQSFLIAGLAIMFSLNGYSKGLIFSQILGVVIIGIVSFLLGRTAIKLWDKKYLKFVANKYRDIPKYLLPASAIDVITLQLPVLLIAVWFGQALAGQFSMAWKLLMMPMSLIGSAIGQVFLQRFAIAIANKKEARSLLIRTWSILLVLGIPPLSIILFFGDDIFNLVLGANWSEAGRISSVLAIMVLFMFVSSPTSGTYLVLGLHKFNLIFSVFSLITRSASLYYGFLTNDIFLGLILFVVFEVIQTTLYQALAWYKLKD